MKESKINVEGIKPIGSKRERLELTTPAFDGRQIFFPYENSGMLIKELIHFGSEKHDDLADAFSLVVLEILVHRKPRKAGLIIG